MVDGRVGSLDIDRVRAAASIHAGGAADREHVHRIGAVVRVEPRRASVRALDAERVGARAERDRQVLEPFVTDAGREAEAGELGRGQRAGVRSEVCAVVGIQRVAARAAGHREPRGDAVQRLAARDGIADVDCVVALAGVDRRLAGDGMHVHGIAAEPGIEVCRAGMRAFDGEHAATEAERDVQHLHAAVGDPCRHLQAGQGRRGKSPELVEVRSRSDVQRVGVAAARDGERADDQARRRRIDRGRLVLGCAGIGDHSDIDRVGAKPGIHGCVAADGQNIDHVIAASRAQQRRT